MEGEKIYFLRRVKGYDLGKRLVARVSNLFGTKNEKKRLSNLVGNNRRLVHVVDRAGWRRGARTGAHMKPLRLLGRPLGGYPRGEAQCFRPLRQTTHHGFSLQFHRQ